MTNGKEKAIDAVLDATFKEFITSFRLGELKAAANECVANGGDVRVRAYPTLELTFEFKGKDNVVV